MKQQQRRLRLRLSRQHLLQEAAALRWQRRLWRQQERQPSIHQFPCGHNHWNQLHPSGLRKVNSVGWNFSFELQKLHGAHNSWLQMEGTTAGCKWRAQQLAAIGWLQGSSPALQRAEGEQRGWECKPTHSVEEGQHCDS
jgi:hypothetical protein